MVRREELVFNLGVIAHFRVSGATRAYREPDRGLHKTAFQGASEYSFKFAKIGDLGANFAEMGRRQGLNLGARGPARFGENEKFLDLADGKADLARPADKG